MWMTPDGVAHTAAHASPGAVVTDRMWQSVVAVAENEGEAAVVTVEDGCDELLNEIQDGRDMSDLTPGLEGEWIPDEYLDGDFTTSAQIAAYLQTLPIDWRIDAFTVVSDLLAELTAPSRWQRLVLRFRRFNSE